jgi:hypothetical protein
MRCIWQVALRSLRKARKQRDYLIAHKTKQSSAVAEVYRSAFPARNMLESQLAALACEDWGDFRT